MLVGGNKDPSKLLGCSKQCTNKEECGPIDNCGHSSQLPTDNTEMWIGLMIVPCRFSIANYEDCPFFQFQK